MRNIKIMNRNKLYAMAIILMTIIALIFISCSGILTAQAETAQSPIGLEQKIYSNFNIDDDFDDSCVIVVMDKFSSEFNKSHSAKFSKLPFVKAIKDLTTLTGIIKEKLYLNKNSFRQIIKIDIKERSKQNVLDAINQLQDIDGVLWAGPDRYAQLDESTEEQPIAMSGVNYKIYQWGLHGFPLDNGIHAPEAWNYSTGSNTVKVGILDTGIANHESLIGNLQSGWNFVDDNDNTNDTYGHGTAIAGIIGATGNVENGTIGVNWHVDLFPLKADVLRDIVQPDGKIEKKTRISLAAAEKALSWAIDNNIDIINMSFGDYYDEEYVPFKTAMSNYTGLMVCSAGNESNDTDINRRYPSAYSQGYDFSGRVISVGAIDKSGNIWNDPDYGSNYGANTVSIFAPGKDIMTTCLPQKDPSGYTKNNMRGTSFAAPHVAGVAALILTKYSMSAHYYNDEYISAQIKSTILNNATKDERYSGKCVSGGRLNAANALKYCPYIPSIMSGYGYNDGWYNWRVKLDMEIENPFAFDYDDNGNLVITEPTKINIAMGNLFVFNAVKKITADIRCVLTDSSGNVIISRYFYEEVTIFSYTKYHSCVFSINTEDLDDDIYTLTWTCNSTRDNKSYYNSQSYTFYVIQT